MKKNQYPSSLFWIWILRREIQNWLCGNEDGQSHYVFWWGFHIGMETRRGRMVYRLISIVDWLYRAPQRCRFALADRLARLVAKLRREKVYVHGWGLYAIGNEAADLRDQIETAMIGRMDLDEYHDEICQQLNRLAQLAEAVTWRNRDLHHPGVTVSATTKQG